MPVGCPYLKKGGRRLEQWGEREGGLTLSLDKFNNTEVLKLNIMLDLMLKVRLGIWYLQ